MNNMSGAILEVQQMAMSVHTRRSEEVVSQRKMPGIIIAFNALLRGRTFSANERLNDVSTDMSSRDRSISFVYRRDKANVTSRGSLFIPIVLPLIRFSDRRSFSRVSSYTKRLSSYLLL